MRDGVADDRDRGWCVGCGERIDLRRWHPVALAPADEPVDLFVFCGPTCRGAYLGDREADGAAAADPAVGALRAEHSR